jgi:hypothetical protein
MTPEAAVLDMLIRAHVASMAKDAEIESLRAAIRALEDELSALKLDYEELTSSVE